ncbi:alpha/beta fold hydrolase [Nocardioides marmorisolisilvae]|uniref:Alpha/beta hydrolase n=1 Tax=Nocardioides marmorisolisilvae TaxID=1542737 RepID=A0A3N0DZC9_9ACTN|nr:alpha/beta hydrolase [Nocardioides marmorisolisilvae]RNL80911.1 alpha/beta hydrolase [Nocardioides marmorisolisilvae]
MAYDLVRSGSGPRLVLLHSGFHTWVEFRRLVTLLSAEYDVLATTQPGSAGGPPLDPRRSMLAQHADYVSEVLDEVGWSDDVTAVGSSFGGVLAIELLGRERVSAAIALAPPWVSGPGLPFYAALFGSVLPALRLTRPLWPYSSRSATINGLWFHQSRRPTVIDTADVPLLLDSVARFPFFRTGLQRREGPGMPDLTRVDSSRVTLAWGTRDVLVPSWMRTRWESALPKARLVQLPGFAHQPHLQDPEAVADLIRDA